MAIKQVSVLVDNEKGSLAKILGILSEKKVDLRSICVADTEDYGILRMIVDDSDKAVKALDGIGVVARVREVLAVAVPDEPGGLYRVLTILSEKGINLEYMYSIINGTKESAYMVLRVNDNDAAEGLLKENGIGVLSEKDI